MVALFRGLGSITQQAFCRSVYTPALLATIVFGESGFLPRKSLLIFVLWCPNGAGLYKNMLLQVVHVYSPDLRKRPFHAGLRGVL